MLTGATASAMYRGYKKKLKKKLNGNTTTTVRTHYSSVVKLSWQNCDMQNGAAALTLQKCSKRVWNVTRGVCAHTLICKQDSHTPFCGELRVVQGPSKSTIRFQFLSLRNKRV